MDRLARLRLRLRLQYRSFIWATLIIGPFVGRKILCFYSRLWRGALVW